MTGNVAEPICVVAFRGAFVTCRVVCGRLKGIKSRIITMSWSGLIRLSIMIGVVVVGGVIILVVTFLLLMMLI